MKIQVICVGKLKESWWHDAAEEYKKRLKKYCRLTVIEIKETRLPGKAAEAEEEAAKTTEGQAILGKIKKGDYVIALEIQGKPVTSQRLAEKLQKLGVGGHSNIAFIIGGSLGLSSAVSQRANQSLSFSNLTFPHQMMRVILLEQIYRSFKIIRGELYHK